MVSSPHLNTGLTLPPLALFQTRFPPCPFAEQMRLHWSRLFVRGNLLRPRPAPIHLLRSSPPQAPGHFSRTRRRLGRRQRSSRSPLRRAPRRARLHSHARGRSQAAQVQAHELYRRASRRLPVLLFLGYDLSGHPHRLSHSFRQHPSSTFSAQLPREGRRDKRSIRHD